MHTCHVFVECEENMAILHRPMLCCGIIKSFCQKPLKTNELRYNGNNPFQYNTSN